MTVVITADRLARLEQEGMENNPVVSIASIYDSAGAFTTGGTTAPRAADGATYTFWTATGALTYALSSAQTCNIAGIAAHDLGTQGATVELEYLAGPSWQTIATITPTDDQTIVVLFDDLQSDEWRWVVTGSASIGVAHIGQAYHFDRRFYQGYDEARFPSRVDLLANQTGPHVLGTSVLSRGSSVVWPLRNLREDTVFTPDFSAFVTQYNAGKPFFAAWRPSDYGRAYYAMREGDPIRVINGGPKRRKELTIGMRVYDD